MAEILLRTSDYVLDIEFRFTDGDAPAGWTAYRRLPSDTPTDKALEMVENLNDTTPASEFRLTGSRIETVKELLT